MLHTQKSRIRETKNLSTNADSRTDTILERLRDLSPPPPKRTNYLQKKYKKKTFESLRDLFSKGGGACPFLSVLVLVLQSAHERFSFTHDKFNCRSLLGHYCFYLGLCQSQGLDPTPVIQ